MDVEATLPSASDAHAHLTDPPPATRTRRDLRSSNAPLRRNGRDGPDGAHKGPVGKGRASRAASASARGPVAVALAACVARGRGALREGASAEGAAPPSGALCARHFARPGPSPAIDSASLRATLRPSSSLRVALRRSRSLAAHLCAPLRSASLRFAPLAPLHSALLQKATLCVASL